MVSLSIQYKSAHTPTHFPDYQMEDITFTHQGPMKCETVHSPNDSPQSSVRQCIRPFSFHSAIVQCSGIKKITHTNEGGRSLCPPLLRDPSGSKNEKRKINHACLLSCVIPAHPATYGCSMILKKFIDGIEDGANNVEPIILQPRFLTRQLFLTCPILLFDSYFISFMLFSDESQILFSFVVELLDIRNK